LHDGRELTAPVQGIPLGLDEEPDYTESSMRTERASGVLLYTDGLTEARRNGEFFGLARVTAALGEISASTPGRAVGVLRARVTAFAPGPLHDDLCLPAAQIN
jgi:phosphoserine phosphatase RsbU/P